MLRGGRAGLGVWGWRVARRGCVGDGFGGAKGVRDPEQYEQGAEQRPPTQRRDTLEEGAGAVVMFDFGVAEDGSVAYLLQLVLE